MCPANFESELNSVDDKIGLKFSHSQSKYVTALWTTSEDSSPQLDPHVVLGLQAPPP